MRVLAPQLLDFAALADGVLRNNVGVAGISFQAQVASGPAELRLTASGQSFRLQGAAPADGWAALRVLHWDDPERTVLEALPDLLSAPP